MCIFSDAMIMSHVPVITRMAIEGFLERYPYCATQILIDSLGPDSELGKKLKKTYNELIVCSNKLTGLSEFRGPAKLE